MSKLPRFILFLVLAVLGGTADLWTTQAIFAWRGLPGQQQPWWLIEGYVGIETAVNIGALFGMGAGLGWLFAIASILAAVGIVIWLFVFEACQSLWLTIAIGLVGGGIMGNLYDRLGFWYEPGLPEEWRSGVRDWILLRYGTYTWPNFNIADSLLVTGAIMLAIYSFTMKPTDSDASSKEVNQPS